MPRPAGQMSLSYSHALFFYSNMQKGAGKFDDNGGRAIPPREEYFGDFTTSNELRAARDARYDASDALPGFRFARYLRC